MADKIKIAAPAIQAITRTLAQLRDAMDVLSNVEIIEHGPVDDLYWIKITKDRSYGRDNDLKPHEQEIVASMQAAGKRRAHEIGRARRAAAVEKALGDIETLRAVLCQQAAAATVELAAITRDARERG